MKGADARITVRMHGPSMEYMTAEGPYFISHLRFFSGGCFFSGFGLQFPKVFSPPRRARRFPDEI